MRKSGFSGRPICCFLDNQKAQEDNMPGALQKSYDGIIIGAGHHGLILGSYLAKAGLSVLLVDRRRPLHQGSDGAGLLS
jgi:ribulose 1,5-bisphosphate synthetase/thiazole synthase